MKDYQILITFKHKSWNYDNTSQGIHINCTAKLYCTNNHLFFFFSLKLGITFLEQFSVQFNFANCFF
ncbi:hypothetical protein RclHR1_12700008 [Rhizophagus clarus]|uniref:Uncharacterized protein n=1 Tax=Rhizophagus clarus TaxID=94130 RepID=A0A2Z6Q7Z1_9GLOM|nr:hypothetical protein RclHR1_12700008 [Rhizophagus clarus]